MPTGSSLKQYLEAIPGSNSGVSFGWYVVYVSLELLSSACSSGGVNLIFLCWWARMNKRSYWRTWASYISLAMCILGVLLILVRTDPSTAPVLVPLAPMLVIVLIVGLFAVVMSLTP